MDIEDFYDQVMSEVRDQTGPSNPNNTYQFPDEVFTHIVLEQMVDSGLAHEDPEIARYDAKLGRSRLLLSGYSISDDGDELDLYVTIFENNEELTAIPDRDVLRQAEGCIRFLEAATGEKLSNIRSDTSVYPLVRYLETRFDEIEKIRITVVTNLRAKSRSYKARPINEKVVQLEVMDFQRFFNHTIDGRPREEIEVNFKDSFGVGLPIVWVPGEVDDYDYALCVFPGEVLRSLYERHGSHILEANVRSFLSATGKTNSGILRTLLYSPERFMAYNNGIVLLADEVRVGREEDGTVSLLYAKGLQIVNGGQTTASLYFGKRKNPQMDLSKVRLAAKIVIPKRSDEASEEVLIGDISRYSNTQNQVRTSDFSSNHPIHVKLEKVASDTYCPDGIGKWFYERSAGSYRVFIEREGRTKAGITALKRTIPTQRKITKTDIAKYMCAWEGKPDLVSLGGQKNFAVFMNLVDEKRISLLEDFDKEKFKKVAAISIAYKSVHKRILKSFKAFQANITAYTFSAMVGEYGAKLNLEKIWQNQAVSDEFVTQALIWAREVNDALVSSSNGRMLSEWSKKSECREALSTLKLSTIQVDEIIELKV